MYILNFYKIVLFKNNSWISLLIIDQSILTCGQHYWYQVSCIKLRSIVGQICEKNRALYDKGMKLGTWPE